MTMTLTTTTTETLFTPVTLGALALPNRVVMAPMTRNRASSDGLVPTPLMAEYYRQRAGAGLIVAEATQVNAQSQGYPNTPGIHTAAQVDGWRHVTRAVHDAGGRIMLTCPDGAIALGATGKTPS